ncbi:hypothetical protein WJX79_005879 [Trebouxia sp. C0005]
MSRQDEKMLMKDLEADAVQCTSWGVRSSQQQCSTCHTVLPTPYLLSLHVSEQHDSFFASQAAQRMPVFQCLVEGCSSRFCLAAQRHQHLTDFHQIPADLGFDRIHLTAHCGQVRPDGICRPTMADEVSIQSTTVQQQDLVLDSKVQVGAAQMSEDANRMGQDTGDQSCASQNANMELAVSAAVQSSRDSELSADTPPETNQPATSGLSRQTKQEAHCQDSEIAAKAPFHHQTPSAESFSRRLGATPASGSASPTSASHVVKRRSAVVQKQPLVVCHSSLENLPADLLAPSFKLLMMLPLLAVDDTAPLRRSEPASDSELCSSSGSFGVSIHHTRQQESHMRPPVSTNSGDTAASSSTNNTDAVRVDREAAITHELADPDGEAVSARKTRAESLAAAAASPGEHAGPSNDALGKEAGHHGREAGVVQIKTAKVNSGASKAGKQAKNKGPSVEELNLELQCERWRHLQWRFLNCRLEEAMAVAKPKAEQGLASVALHVADLHNQVTQQQSELRAVERQRRVEAALASQMPRLQRWQSMQADQQKNISAVQSALSHAMQHVPLLNGAFTGAAEQAADASLVAGEVAKLRDALRQSQQHVDSLMGQAVSAASTEVPAIMAQDSDGSTEAAGDMGRTARMVTELAETSHELKQYLGANSALLESYSHELLHVEALQGHSGVQFCKLINLGRATAKDKLSLQMNLRRRVISKLRSTSMAMKQFDVDVAVVGGGPGGLAAAAAIGSAFGTDTTVKIYESLKKYTLQGSGVLMMPNVQNALEAIQPSLLQKFIANGVRGGGSKIYDTDDKLLMTIPPGMTGNIEALSEKYGKAPFFLGWHEIRHLLYESLPAGVVEFDKQMKSYEETEDGVTLHFDHGQPPVHARLVVGADGYFSKVRTQCLNDGPPDFVGSVMWRARIGWQEGMENPVDGPSRVYGKPGPMNINKQFAILFKMGTLEETKTSQDAGKKARTRSKP